MKKGKIAAILLIFFSCVGAVHAQIDLLGVEEETADMPPAVAEQTKPDENFSSAAEQTVTDEINTGENNEEKPQSEIENKADATNASGEEAFPTDDLFADERSADTTPDLLENQDTAPKAGDIVNEYITDLETARQAQQEARKILQQDPEVVTLRQNQHKMIESGDQKRLEIKKHFQKSAEQGEEPVEEVQNETVEENVTAQTSDAENPAEETGLSALKKVVTESYQAAPFGLYWGISHEELETLGYELQPATHENYQNVYRIVKKEGENKTFKDIYGIFGQQNKLWGISAQTDLIDDKPDAAEVLELYHQYYQALEKKYGHAREFFEPYTYDELVDQEVEDEKTKEKVLSKVVQTKTNPLGGENFLEELRSGKASLYATFETTEIGVMLDVRVAKDGRSQLILDYKNLPLMQAEKDKKFENLVQDL